VSLSKYKAVLSVSNDLILLFCDVFASQWKNIEKPVQETQMQKQY